MVLEVFSVGENLNFARFREKFAVLEHDKPSSSLMEAGKASNLGLKSHSHSGRVYYTERDPLFFSVVLFGSSPPPAEASVTPKSIE